MLKIQRFFILNVIGEMHVGYSLCFVQWRRPPLTTTKYPLARALDLHTLKKPLARSIFFLNFNKYFAVYINAIVCPGKGSIMYIHSEYLSACLYIRCILLTSEHCVVVVIVYIGRWALRTRLCKTILYIFFLFVTRFEIQMSRTPRIGIRIIDDGGTRFENLRARTQLIYYRGRPLQPVVIVTAHYRRIIFFSSIKYAITRLILYYSFFISYVYTYNMYLANWFLSCFFVSNT